MNTPRNLAVALSIYLAGAFAVAGGIETKGAPSTPVSPLGTYGLGVSSSTALKTIIPAGWKTYVHQSVALPPTMDWSVADTWVVALDKMAQSADTSVLIDWSSKSVLIRPVAVAEQERSVRTEIVQAATTPLPKLSQESKPLPVSAVSSPVATEPKVTLSAPVELALSGSMKPSVTSPEPGSATKAAPGFAQAKAEPEQQPKYALNLGTAENPVDTKAPAVPSVPVAVKEPSHEPLPASDSLSLAEALVPTAQVEPAVLKTSAPTPLPAFKYAEAPKAPIAPEPPKAGQSLAIAAPSSASVGSTVQPIKSASEPALQVAAIESVRQSALATRSDSAPRNVAEAKAQLHSPVASTAPVLARTEPVSQEKPVFFNETLPNRVSSEMPVPVALPVASTAPVVAIAAPAPTTAPVVLPVLRTNPTVALLPTVRASSSLASNADFVYVKPVALNKPTARKTLSGIAARFNMRLVWALSEDVQLKGPVTLLADSAQQDVDLLQKAIGRGTPLNITVSPEEHVIRVFRRGGAQPVDMMAAVAGPGLESSAPVALNDTPNPSLSASQPKAASPSTAVASIQGDAVSREVPDAVPMLRLDVPAGQPLEDALTRFIAAQGYSLEWRIEGGFEAGRALSYQGETLVKVLSQFLPPLNLSADIYTREKLVVVRPADLRE